MYSMDDPRYRYTPWSAERKRAASVFAKQRWAERRQMAARTEPVQIHKAGSSPAPFGEWVLGYWPHMQRSFRRGAHALCAGWYCCRLREWGWTMRHGSESWRMDHGPQYWTMILPSGK